LQTLKICCWHLLLVPEQAASRTHLQKVEGQQVSARLPGSHALPQHCNQHSLL
jgi:hypothetical protein